jgi:hypothetical protein
MKFVFIAAYFCERPVVSSTAQKRSPLESAFGFLGKGLAISGVCAAFVGCSGSPQRIEGPAFDPVGSAAKAMEIYDKDGDGLIAEEELEAAVSLKAAIKNLDKDKDGKISSEEISNRISSWQSQRIGLMLFQCSVTMDGSPLSGVKIKFEPEEILGDIIRGAEATTNMVGTAIPFIPLDQQDGQNQPTGMDPGLYKVRFSLIVDGKETIPARYNTETIIGQEVSEDDPAISNNRVQYNLKSK